MKSLQEEREAIKWTEETKAISEAWWNYWNYQGTPDRDFIEKWWLERLLSHEEKVVARVRERIDKLPTKQISILQDENDIGMLSKRAVLQALTLPITDEKV